MPLLFAFAAAVGLLVLAGRSKKPGTSPVGGPDVPLPAPPTPKPTPPTPAPPLGGLPDVLVPLPPAAVLTTVRGADGVLAATDAGRGIALMNLLRYGPVAVELSGTGTGVAGRTAAVTKRFLGPLGAPGTPPLAIGDTAIDWIRQRLIEGQYVLLSAALFHPVATPDTLPNTTSLLAVVPNASAAAAVQLGPIMGAGSDWVLLGDPVALGPQALLWPMAIDTFLTRLGALT